MIPHFALVLLLPAAWLTWRWSRLVSGALWFTLAVWLVYRGIRWAYPDTWSAGYLEWMRGVSMVTGFCGAWSLYHRESLRQRLRRGPDVDAAIRYAYGATMREMPPRHYREPPTVIFTLPGRRPDYLAALLVASMGVDLAALLIHRGAGQWGPQPVFQCIVLLAMCAASVWPRRK